MHSLRSRLVIAALALATVVAPALAATAAAAAPLPAPTVSPDHVLQGGRFVVAGVDCTSQDPANPAGFEVSVARGGQGFGGGGSANPSGSWQIDFDVPANFPTGTYQVTSKCQADKTRRYPDVTMTVASATQPRVVLSANTVTAGDRLTVEASGFDPREHVDVQLRSVGLLTVATTDPNGAVAAEVTVPSTTPAGRQHVDVIAEDGTMASAPVAVLAPPGRCGGTSCEPTPSPPLATTGVSTVQLLLVGLAMMAIGAAMMTAGLRRAD